jgi:hypothetical protein
MKTTGFFLLLGLLTSALATAAEDTPRQATVIAVKGSVLLKRGGTGPAEALKPGVTIAEKANIVTQTASEVTLRFFDNTVSVIQQNSDVTVDALAAKVEGGATTKETTLLRLRTGGIISTLDPAKKKISDFKVRTPKGVAAARGTVFSVIVSQDQTDATVTTMSGTVTFITDTGSITVSFGQVSTGGAVMTVAQAVAANPAIAQMFVDAATSVAGAVGAGSITDTAGSPNHINTVLAAVTLIACEAAPTQAGSIAGNVLTAAAPGLGSGAEATALVIAQAAVQGVANVGGNTTQASSDVNAAILAAASAANLSVDPSRLNSAINAGVNPSTNNTILPPLDQTQEVVSPSKTP